jgi:hypothetical protein
VQPLGSGASRCWHGSRSFGGVSTSGVPVTPAIAESNAPLRCGAFEHCRVPERNQVADVLENDWPRMCRVRIGWCSTVPGIPGTNQIAQASTLRARPTPWCKRNSISAENLAVTFSFDGGVRALRRVNLRSNRQAGFLRDRWLSSWRGKPFRQLSDGRSRAMPEGGRLQCLPS